MLYYSSTSIQLNDTYSYSVPVCSLRVETTVKYYFILTRNSVRQYYLSNIKVLNARRSRNKNSCRKENNEQ